MLLKIRNQIGKGAGNRKAPALIYLVARYTFSLSFIPKIPSHEKIKEFRV